MTNARRCNRWVEVLAPSEVPSELFGFALAELEVEEEVLRPLVPMVVGLHRVLIHGWRPREVEAVVNGLVRTARVTRRCARTILARNVRVPHPSNNWIREETEKSKGWIDRSCFRCRRWCCNSRVNKSCPKSRISPHTDFPSPSSPLFPLIRTLQTKILVVSVTTIYRLTAISPVFQLDPRLSTRNNPASLV